MNLPKVTLKLPKVTRWRAAGVHLLLSAAVAAVALALLLFVWYPPPLFVAAGGQELLFLLVGVDVIVGPLITLIVYRAGKRGLGFDLAAIGLVQAAALIYGVGIVYLARPAFIVFAKDRFEVATAVELAPENLAEARFDEFRRPPLFGPALAAADYPADQAEQQRMVKLNALGLDLQHFPKFWVPYGQRAKEILAKADSIERLRKVDPKAARVVDEWLAASGTPEAAVRFVALRAPRAWVAVLLDASSAEPVRMLVYEKL